MAVYKVPQDVEADDKLIGPFSFRQFIYLIIVAISIAVGWGLSQLFLPLAILPLPIVLFFGVMALPLRKDQPMEIYMAAVVSFFLKPRKRLWQPDGIQSLVEITAPKTVEIHRTKDLSRAEAAQRLSYLADIVDTGGWAVRGVAQADETGSPMQTDVYYEAQQTEDILDESGGVARSFDSMISQSDAKRHQEILTRMQQLPDNVSITPPPIADPYAAIAPAPAAEPQPQPQPQVQDQTEPQPQPQPQPVDPQLTYDPYPTSIRQSTIAPLDGSAPVPEPPIDQPAAAPAPQPNSDLPAPSQPDSAPTTSEKAISPDIINLANNQDLSIETISREAHRIQEQQDKQDDDEEVVISLR